MRTFATCTGIVAVAAAMACASARPDDRNGQERATAPSRSSDIALEKELRESSARTALEFVRQRRPQWVRVRGVVRGAPPEPVVYLGETRLGGLQSLAQFPTTTIRELRYFSASDATSRWGTGHMAGAIVVIIE